MASKEHDLLPLLTEIQAVKYFNTLKVFSTWEKGREFLGLDGVKMLTDFLEKLSGSKPTSAIFVFYMLHFVSGRITVKCLICVVLTSDQWKLVTTSDP